MQLKVCLPREILIDRPVLSVNVESEHGGFSLLPHHIDCLAILVPGILTYLTVEQVELFIALDEGILVKCGPLVKVSARHGVEGQNLSELKTLVDERFRILNEQEQRTRSALAQLEASLARSFIASDWGL